MDVSQKTILITSGASFISTHTMVQLLNEGFKVSIIDNLDNSIIKAIDRVKELVGPELSKKLQFNLGDLRNRDDLDKLFSKTKNEKDDSVNVSYYHIVNPSTNITIGVEVTHSFFTNVNTITVGTQHVLDPLTTIKAPVSNAGKASALIQHEWRSKSFFTNFGEVDTKSIDKSPKVGLALALKP
ncbi:hypothetical protein J1N35_004827 [Gossypium stocksii]|uniref:NAD(P)-binding domain-containing protein n=1 Tax=Gossypium stocksii TaxID=47602 RepID=A0A9D4AGG8_9ROSI|nr:hypothetical protein J1N35_004827 [Gossypium stocksii]